MFMNPQEAREAFLAHKALHEKNGVYSLATSYLPDSFKDKDRGWSIAMDAQPGLTTDPNAGIPSWLTMYIDPKVYEILFAPVEAAAIMGEERKGDWTTQTAMFPVVEHTGEVSSYGDFNNNGVSGTNVNFPQFQSYLYQTMLSYGDLETARMGEARINWVSELEKSSANNLNRFENFVYFYGVAGLQNYGLLNNPYLSASLTPAPKGYGGTSWLVGTVVKATPNEVYNDIQSLYVQLVNQTAGLVNEKTKLCLAMSPASSVALKAANSFGVNTYELLEENFPNIRYETAVQYGQQSSSNPQGIAGGNFVQLIAEEVDGQKTGFCAFNEKMRSHPIIRDVSAFKQKKTGGAWGTIIRMPIGISSMLGV